MDFKTQFGKNKFVFAATLAFISASLESSICIPALLDIKEYYNISNETTKLIMSINFIGLALSNLVFGSIGDYFGKYKSLMFGMILLVISNLGCSLSPNIFTFLFFRLLQGVSSAAPIVICSAVIIDKYGLKKSPQILSLINGIITMCLFISPLIGSWITKYVQWRANFIFLLFLSLIALLTIFFWFKKINNINSPVRNIHSNFFKSTLQNFKFLFSSKLYFLHAISWGCISSILIIFFSYLPFIIKEENKLHLSIGEYQSIIMLIFFISSLITSNLIKKLGINKISDYGYYFIACSLFFMILSILSSLSFILLFIGIALFSVSNAILMGIIASKALSNAKKLTGLGSSIHIPDQDEFLII